MTSVGAEQLQVRGRGAVAVREHALLLAQWVGGDLDPFEAAAVALEHLEELSVGPRGDLGDLFAGRLTEGVKLELAVLGADVDGDGSVPTLDICAVFSG